MKTYYIFIGITILSYCSSCQSEHDLDISYAKKFHVSIEKTDISPLISTEDAILADGTTAKLPWASSTITTIPEEIRKDVKEEDGWKILYSTVKIIGYPYQHTKVDSKANYILLYNRYTGVLKGFYYAMNVSPNNNALWHLIFSNNSTLSNFASYFALPNSQSASSMTLSNLSTNGVTSGFENGWNCFMQELAYDPNSLNETLSISGYTLNKATINFSGAYKGESKGTMISTTAGISNAMSGIAQQYGNEAKKWIENNIRTASNSKAPILSKFIVSGARNILAGSVPNLLSSGLGNIFGSLLGVGTRTTTQQLQFSTNGEVKLSGESCFPASGMIWPLAGIPLNGIGENLGIWNLKETPLYEIADVAELKNISSSIGGQSYSEYIVKASPNYTFIKNPACTWSVVPQIEIVEYQKYNAKPININPIGGYNVPHAYILSGDKLYEDSANTILAASNTYHVLLYSHHAALSSNSYILPNMKTTNGNPAFNLSGSQSPIKRNIAIKINTTIYPGEDKCIISCKTFIPKQQYYYSSGNRPYFWNFQELSNKGYVRN